MLLGVVLMVAACAPQVPMATAPPIIFVSATPRATNVPAPSPTPLTRRTLPPSWTPSIPTATLDLIALPREATNVPERCDAFTPDFDRNRPTFNFGFAPEIYWRLVSTASLYRVRLYNPRGEVVFGDDTPNDVYVFPPELFSEIEPYGWEVIPLDTERNQLCQPIGSILIGSFGPGNTPSGT